MIFVKLASIMLSNLLAMVRISFLRFNASDEIKGHSLISPASFAQWRVEYGIAVDQVLDAQWNQLAGLVKNQPFGSTNLNKLKKGGHGKSVYKTLRFTSPFAPLEIKSCCI